MRALDCGSPLPPWDMQPAAWLAVFPCGRFTADDHAGPLAALLKKVALGQDIGNPTVILLQHQYTEANFSLRKLKGGDRQRAAALFAAAGKAGLTARLALATLYQMGELEDGYDYGSRNHRSSRGHDDPEKGTMGEVYEESLELGHWRDAGDRKVTMGAFLVSLEEVITAEDFSKTDPDEKAGEGYTGNAGCTMEYWYRRAAVVLWPEGCEEEIHCARNMADACESLLGMSTGKKTGPGSPFDKLAQAAIRVMVSQDDSAHHPYRHLDTEIRLPVTRLASALARAKRGDLVENWRTSSRRRASPCARPQYGGSCSRFALRRRLPRFSDIG